jgi:hypothetical protein
MKDSLQANESSIFTRKTIAIAIAVLTVFGVALWATLEMALRMTSGQS